MKNVKKKLLKDDSQQKYLDKTITHKYKKPKIHKNANKNPNKKKNDK